MNHVTTVGKEERIQPIKNNSMILSVGLQYLTSGFSVAHFLLKLMYVHSPYFSMEFNQ